MTLEEFLARFNENLFFREFSFSQTKFTPPAKSELELADHIVWLDGLLLTFQLKERAERGETTAEGEEKWFSRKVLGKAKKQVKDTHHYIKEYAPVEVINERGDTWNLQRDAIKTWHDIILYESHPLLPPHCRQTKSVQSSEAGFVHVLHISDYSQITHTLLTLAEVDDYLSYRREVLTANRDLLALSEKALLGHFLWGHTDTMPQASSERFVNSLLQERDDFDISPFLREFQERIVPGEAWGLSATNRTDYYRIVQELAKLKRTGFKHVKERMRWVLEWSQKGETRKPTRFTSRTGCGFVFIAVPPEKRNNLQFGLQNYTEAHKYDQKLNKCVGMALSKDGQYFDIGWCFIEGKWQFDAEMDKHLNDNFPFHPVKQVMTPIYSFEVSDD